MNNGAMRDRSASGGRAMRPDGSVDVVALIDELPLSRLQILILILCGLVGFLDGMDTFSMGVAAPSIAAKLLISLSGFGPIFSAALLGATVGAFAFGLLADRFGRKAMLVVATLLFSTFTFLTALPDSVQMLIAVRFLAGLGLGGATPCFLSLASEYTPSRIRASVISALWASFPLGGMIGGFLNAYLIAVLGWQSMFYVGGVFPLIIATLFALLAPESLRHQIARGVDRRRLAGIVQRLAPGFDISATVVRRFIVNEVKLSGVPIRHLFTDGRGPSTLFLWVPFFMAFAVLIIVVLWTPALLRQQGMAASSAAVVVGFHGLGAFIGMAVAGRLLERFGTLVLVPAFLVGGVCTLALGIVGTSTALASTCTVLIGVFVGVGASGVIALAATAYPASIRSTGLGAAMAMGRLGQVFGPLLVGLMLQAGWGIATMFMVVALAPIVAALFVLFTNFALSTGRMAVDAGIAVGSDAGSRAPRT
jgi:AAHS family 4-hydroxybenzoate transporter-like MFS transporter